MPRFNHMFSLAFTVVSDTEDASDVTPAMLKAGLLRRIASLDEENPDQWLEAAGMPEDSYEETGTASVGSQP